MRLVFDPPPAGTEGELQDTGPWALFRLFGRGRMQAQAGTTDRYTLTFQPGGRQAVFDVRVLAPANPLAIGLLQDFRCPNVRAN
jgi:type VI secretion system protein ImpL